MADSPPESPSNLLPWHPLGCLTCLLGQTKRPSAVKKDVYYDLPAAAIKKAFEPNQTLQTPGGLFDVIAKDPDLVFRDFYRELWDASRWPQDLAVHIRRMPEGTAHGLFYLSPKALVVAWPVARDSNPPTNKPTLGEALRDAGATPIPSANDLASEYPDGIWLDAFMNAADDAVTTLRKEFEAETRLEATAARAWILSRARAAHGYKGPPYPSSLSVVVEEARDTRATSFHVQSGQPLTLHLGWRKDPNKMDQWPCGPFGP